MELLIHIPLEICTCKNIYTKGTLYKIARQEMSLTFGAIKCANVEFRFENSITCYFRTDFAPKCMDK